MPKNLESKKGPVWNVLLSTWYSMLNSVDYLRKLSPYQVAVLPADKIQSIGKKVIHLSVDGIRLWSEEQLDSLSSEQLGVFDNKRAQIIAAHASAKTIRRWLLEGASSSVDRQLPAIINGIGRVDASLRSVGLALNKRRSKKVAARLLNRLLEHLDDEALRLVVAELSNKTLEQLIQVDIKSDLSGDPQFRQRMEKEFTDFIKSRTEYAQRISLYQGCKKELDSFQRRLLSAKDRTIREKIYSELQERLAELPFAGLTQLLLPWGRIFRLSSRRAQNEVLRELFDELKSALDSDQELFEDQYGMYWLSYEEISGQWATLKKQVSRHKKQLKAIMEELEATEQLLRPIAGKLSSGEYDRDLLETVDGYVQKFALSLMQFDELADEFADVADRAQTVCSGISHLLEKERFAEEMGEEYVGAMPIRLFERLMGLSLYDPRGGFSKKALIQFFSKQKSLKRFQKSFELYADVFSTTLQIDQLFEQLESLKLQDELLPKYEELEIILRCRKKVEAWDFFKAQTAPFQGGEE